MRRSILASLVVCLAGCGGNPVIETGPGAEITYDGLYRVTNARAENVWIKPNIDLSQYDQLLLVSSGITYRSAAPRPYRLAEHEFPLTNDQKARIEAAVNEVLHAELARSTFFTMTDTPGPRVLEVKLGLHDVVSRVPVARSPANEFYLTNLGEGMLVVELRDSRSDEVFARLSDRQRVEPNGVVRSSSAGNIQEVRTAVSRWGVQLRQGIDELHALGCFLCGTEL